jgi:radical SAM protein with 4Fe4S-binding SPASM domain
MTDNYRIDSHKLIFHPQRVAAWMSGEIISPIYVEISPSGACNHRCTFCAFDYVGYQTRFIETGVLKERLTEMAGAGVKSVMYAGEGEPLLHRDIAEIIRHTTETGIDVGLTTNGVLLSRDTAERIIGHTAWIKVSLNAGTPETYARIHRTNPADFRRVLDNLAAAVRARDESASRCVVGAQILLLPENESEVEELAMRLRDIGLAYLVVKPYSQNPLSNNRVYQDMDYSGYARLRERLAGLNTPSFSVVIREQPMKKLQEASRGYERCLALPFWCYIDATGMVWGCFSFLGDERFAYGRISEQSFAQIWWGERRLKHLQCVADQLDTRQCRVNCRMDEINRYLWELTHPHDHVNFI